MPGFIKTAEDEKLWSKAKASAKAQGHEEDWAYINGIYQKMKGKEAYEMNAKETDSSIPVFPLQSGNKVSKSGKDGEIMQVSPNQDVLVMWKDGSMTQEKPNSLKKVNESAFTQYLKKEKRL